MTMPKPETEDAIRRKRRLEAIRLHEIEGNPFTPEDNALFEMFDRKGWSDAQRRSYLIREAQLRAEIAAAAE